MRKASAPGTASPNPSPIHTPSTNGKPPAKPPSCYYCGDRPAMELPAILGIPNLVYFCSTVCAAKAAIEDCKCNLVWCEVHEDWYLKDLGCTGCCTEVIEHREHVERAADCTDPWPKPDKGACFVIVEGQVLHASIEQALVILSDIHNRAEPLSDEGEVHHV